ncbi:GNAT family N-acetyltransferase [bacterium]|jgi:[ribosomal protein S18]-alanine N-acetyltransferase|nr:GNAT family N-acetyltransferase [bacterium]
MITKANLKDLSALYNIEREVFSNDPFSMSKNSIKYHIIKNELYKIEFDGVIAGYILWLKRKKYYRLYSLAIGNDFQNRGFAKKLLAYSFENLIDRDFSLEVKVLNETAINLYKKFGFEIKKVLKDYYEECDGYLMYKKESKA